MARFAQPAPASQVPGQLGVTRVALLGGLALGLTTLLACDPPIYGVDHPAMMARWESNYFGACSSWLFSHKSGRRYCASPAIDLHIEVAAPAPTGPTFDTTKTDKASLMAAGEKVYGTVCAACHQADGKGLAGQFPPLAGSGAFYGDAANMAKIVVHGLNGAIEVQGQAFNGAMPSQGHLSDYELAAAMTFVRHSWGNDDGVVTPDDVKAAR